MNFDTWVKNNLGKKIDADGVYGVQCVDLIKHYCVNVLGISKKYSDAWGNAVDWYNGFNNKSWLTANFTRIANTPTFVPKKGDVAVFRTKSKNGHIAVCNGIGDTKSFQAYDENYNGTGAGMTLRTFKYSGTRTLLGVLRPKNQSNIVSEKFKVGNTYTLTTNVKVRTGAGTNYTWKKVGQLTPSGQIRCTSQNKNDYAVLRKGIEIIPKAIKKIGSDIWVEIINGWVCVKYKSEFYAR